jgi:hypothetical protein
VRNLRVPQLIHIFVLPEKSGCRPTSAPVLGISPAVQAEVRFREEVRRDFS